MGATTIAVLAVGALVGIYLYVMGLCYLCDLYALRKQKKLEEAEQVRKERIREALDRAEMKRKQELRRRKQLARARREKGVVTPDTLSRNHLRPKRATAARA